MFFAQGIANPYLEGGGHNNLLKHYLFQEQKWLKLHSYLFYIIIHIHDRAGVVVDRVLWGGRIGGSSQSFFLS